MTNSGKMYAGKTKSATISKLTMAQSVSYKSPKLSIGWQLRLYTQKLPICIPMKTCGKSFTGQHAISFRQSRILADAAPLGFCCGGFSSTFGYVPTTWLNFRRTNRPLRRVLFQRVLLVFIRVAEESLTTFSSQAFRLRLRASLGLAAACLSSLSVRHRTDCRSLRRSQRP